MKKTVLFLSLCLCITYSTNAQITRYAELGNDPSQVSDTRVLSRYPSTTYGALIVNQVLEGTSGGVRQNTRSFFRFDNLLNEVPSGAIIDSAKLEFYVLMPTWWPHSTNNEFYISRVLDPWDEMTTNYLNQPSVNQSDQLINSTIYPPYYQGWESKDVTNHVQHFINNPQDHHGWGVRLVTEVRHRMVMFYSSDYNNGSHTPKLKIWYRAPYCYQLNRVNDGSISFTNGKQLFFKYDEEYNEGSINYQVYEDHSMVNVTQNTQLTTTNKEPSHNSYRLDCSALSEGYYLLELTTEKKQKFTLRFSNKF